MAIETGEAISVNKYNSVTGTPNFSAIVDDDIHCPKNDSNSHNLDVLYYETFA